MTRSHRITGTVVLAVVATILAGVAAAQQTRGFDFVDVSDFPTVRLVITPPTGIDPDVVAELLTYQDGVEVPSGVFPLATEPVEMVLLIDSSGSMAGEPIAAAKVAAVEFVDALPVGSEVMVLAFGSTVSVVADLGATRDGLAAAVGAVSATGETALYDAVLAAVAAVDRTPLERQFVVVLSDGADTASVAGREAVVAALERVPVGFYAIELAGSEQDPEALAAMAAAAGGVVVPAADSSGLAQVYLEIARSVTSQYAVVFRATGGGSTTIELLIGSGSSAVRFADDLVFPPLPGVGPAAVVTIPPPGQRVLTPPVTRVMPGAGTFEGAWALTLGVVLVGLVMALVFAFALQPGESRTARVPLVPRGFEQDTVRRRSRIPLLRRAEEGVGMMLGTKRRRGIEAALEAAGISLTVGEYLVLVVLAAAGGLAIGLLTDSPMLGLILMAVAVVLPRTLVANAVARRRAAFADQLEGTLQLIAGSMRAGYGLSQAFSTVAAEAPSPTSSEFGRIVVEVRVGRPMTPSLRAAAERMRNDDFAWVADAIAIQQEVGGNLAEVLDAVSATIRDRNQIRRQIRALSAEGRISAAILIGLPFVAAGAISVLNPGYLDPLFSTTGGRVALVLGSVLMILGVAWIRRVIRIVF